MAEKALYGSDDDVSNLPIVASRSSTSTNHQQQQPQQEEGAGSAGFWKRRIKTPGVVISAQQQQQHQPLQQQHSTSGEQSKLRRPQASSSTDRLSSTYEDNEDDEDVNIGGGSAATTSATTATNSTASSAGSAPKIRLAKSTSENGAALLTDLSYSTAGADVAAAAPRSVQRAPNSMPVPKLVSSTSSSPTAELSSPRLSVSSDAITTPTPMANKTASKPPRTSVQSERQTLFERLLAEHNVDLETLRKHSWKGIPDKLRAEVWKLLMGYLPSNADRRTATIERKRREYLDQTIDLDNPAVARTGSELKTWNQITIDMPRTHPTVPLFHDELIHAMQRRVLYIWSIRHPASGYVQGINDLATPFLVVFLATALNEDLATVCARQSIADVDIAIRSQVEADVYWCFSRLLDGIQDNYTFAQPGIQRMVHKLHDVVARVDRPLSLHLASHDCQFIQFAFRWFNCLLIRELSLSHIVRMWDSYLSEGEGETGGFASFHVYVCCAFLCRFSRELRQLDFQEIMLFLQRLPTELWVEQDIELLLSQDCSRALPATYNRI